MNYTIRGSEMNYTIKTVESSGAVNDCDICCYRGGCAHSPAPCQATRREDGKNVHFEMVPETITHTASMNAVVQVNIEIPVKMVIPDGSLTVGEQNAMKQVIESLPANSKVTHINVAREEGLNDWN